MICLTYLTTMSQASLVSKHSLTCARLCSLQKSVARQGQVVVLQSVTSRPGASTAPELVRGANSQALSQIQ